MKYKVTKKQNNSNDCIVCGLNTSASLKAEFYELENDTIVAIFTPKNQHQSYPDRMHGGMICAILDEVMGRGIQIGDPNAWGVTGSIEIKYKKAVPLNKEIKCVGKITSNRARIFEGEGFIEDGDGNILATGKALYFRTAFDNLENQDEFGWKQTLNENEPTEIEIANMEYFNKKQ